MAKKSIKIRAKEKGGVVTFKALMTHPMETGMRKNKKTGKMYPAHFIQEVTVTSAGKTVMTAYWGGSVSKNPYLSFKYAGKKGDAINLTWKDNTGASDSADSKVK
ncbi:MAG: thiosulfate oxidation carrier complex protein SoxZ [gamma proteobacterium symbiont of Bathyaustriella thionipta]|nr:thiosulfate oxidation carrier complex protein SoxZ [gamma proteobacterium symbiont of Bathyaustriella thionipta]